MNRFQLVLRSVLGGLFPILALSLVWIAGGEENPPVAPQKIARPAKPKAGKPEFDYPVLNDIELMDRLTEAGVKMMEEKVGKGSKDINIGLDCRKTELKLAPVRQERLSDEQLYAQACESIFVVCGLFKTEDQEQWDAAFATAFVVSPDGVLTTSRHFFDDPQPCEVFLAADMAGNVYPITEILCSDDKMDTCLFRIPAENLKPLPIGEKSPMPGSRVRIISHPGYFFYFFSSGQVANYYKDDADLRWMNVTADFGQGSSGAPAFDEFGNVVGQVASTLTLYAVGGIEEDPNLSRRKITRSAEGEISVSRLCGKEAQIAAAEDSEESTTKKKRKKKKKKEREEETLSFEEIADPQMVFKTCSPLESIRGLVK